MKQALPTIGRNLTATLHHRNGSFLLTVLKDVLVYGYKQQALPTIGRNLTRLLRERNIICQSYGWCNDMVSLNGLNQPLVTPSQQSCYCNGGGSLQWHNSYINQSIRECNSYDAVMEVVRYSHVTVTKAYPYVSVTAMML